MTVERRLIDDCFLTDKERLRHDEALAIIRARVGCVVGVEQVPLGEAHGRILAETVTSPHAVPQNDNAAVDGYAYAAADYDAAGGWFPVDRRIAAGHPPDGPHLARTAARIFTGGVMPEGADTVAMQEDCEPHVQDGRDFVAVPPGLKPGANRRRAGEDVAAGAEILTPGTVLRPQEVAAIASTGAGTVAVRQRLRVGLVSTGDEIVRPGSGLGPGQVYDSNHFLLGALLASVGAETHDLGVLPDQAEIVRRRIAEAAEGHDAILTTGGASRGEEDHIVEAVDALGQRHLWQIAVKPGRPMSFGQIGDAVFLGLPGNPVAVMVCFLLYARPMLMAMQGAAWREPTRYRVASGFAVARKKPDRREFYRGWLETGPDGAPIARKFARDGSGLISSLRAAHGLIEIPEETTGLAEGDPVAFIPFGEMGLA